MLLRNDSLWNHMVQNSKEKSIVPLSAGKWLSRFWYLQVLIQGIDALIQHARNIYVYIHTHICIYYDHVEINRKSKF